MHQGSTIPTATTPTTTTTIPGSNRPLPFTGSDSANPALFGLGCLLAGGLLALRRRRAWF
ncbi:MAG: LPXTG cell wall anchor domain-containing protein [Acidimicrobiia bacterium]